MNISYIPILFAMTNILTELSDIDGQINRCKERIEDNIMPEIFEKRLADYEAQRDDLLYV